MAYIDDILVMAEMEEKSRDHTEGLFYLLENLGFMIHAEKKITAPTQEIRVPLDGSGFPDHGANERLQRSGIKQPRPRGRTYHASWASSFWFLKLSRQLLCSAEPYRGT